MHIDSAPWGVEFNALPPHIDRYPEELEKISAQRIDSLVTLVSELGVKWVRLSVNWSNVVDTSGNYHWEKIDQIVNGLNSKKINISLCINGGHKRYTNTLAPNNPETIRQWKLFLEAFVSRYKDQVNHWELWNEPNTVWFWKPYPKAKEYVNLMKEFHALIKKADPDAKIIGGSLARLDLVFADSLFQQGLGKYINAISYHPYNEFPEAIINPLKVPVKTPVWYSEADHSISRLKEMIDANNPNIKLWQGECGYPSQDNGSGWMGNGPWSPTIQAKWLLRRMMVDLSYNAEVTNYFCLVEYITGGNVDEGKGILNSKGLLNLHDLKAKPAFLAYQNLTSALNGSLYAEFSSKYNIEITKEGSFYNISPKNIKILEIKNHRGAKFLAYWVAWRMQDMIDPASVNIKIETKFQSPKLINLLTGAVSDITIKDEPNGQQLLQLPLADYPFLITEASNITTK